MVSVASRRIDGDANLPDDERRNERGVGPKHGCHRIHQHFRQQDIAKQTNGQTRKFAWMIFMEELNGDAVRRDVTRCVSEGEL